MQSGDIFGILLFAVFLAVSVVGTMMKNQRGTQDGERAPRRQQWPGPTAQPGLPGYPRPAMPPAQRQPARPPQPGQQARPPQPGQQARPPQPGQQTRPPQPPIPRWDADDDDEGVSIEGVSVEGPAPGETVQAELARFDRETSRLARPDFGQYQPRLEQYHSKLGRLKTTLHAPDAEPGGGLRAAGQVASGLDAALADPEGVARAFVLAEVLGKPKALRGRSR